MPWHDGRFGVKTGKAQCEQMFSASPLRADIAQRSQHVRFVPIVLQKSFLAGDGNFLDPLVRFARGDVRVHIGSHKNDHGPPYPSYRALQRRRRQKNRLSRDFRRRSIFDFCNTIGGKADLPFILRSSLRVVGPTG
jgi:hypothetical protein